MLKRLRLIAGAFLQRERFEQEMSAELQFHLQAYADDLERSGVPRAEAERRARREFGRVDTVQEDCRQARGLQLWDELRQDLRYGARQLRKAPVFTAAAVVSLALGIGANTAIFSLIDALLYRTLPVENPHELFFFGHRGTSPEPNLSSNYPLLERYRELDAFDGVTAYTFFRFPIATEGGVEPVNGQFVSGNYHAVVGARFAAGRGFSSEPDQPSGQMPIAVISDAYWARRFDRSPDAIGQTLVVSGRPTTIVGVTAPGFHGLVPGTRMDVTVPMWVAALDDARFLTARDSWTSLTLTGRLAAGASLDRARAMVDAEFQRYWMEPENAWARPLWARRDGSTPRAGALVSASRGNESLRRAYGTPLLVLMATVAIVLLIACSNVANLMLARGAARRRETALRMSIGAGPARLIRQHLTESLLLSLLGGALGLGVAAASTKVVLSLLATGRNAVFLDVAFDGQVLAATTVLSLLTGVVFGLFPALRATRVNTPAALIHGDAQAPGRLRQRTGKSLVVAQVALCALLVTTAALLLTSVHNLRQVDAGFERGNLVMFNVETYDPSFTTEQRTAFYSALHERLSAMPGVLSVSLAKRSPLDSSTERRRFEIPGIAPSDTQGGVSGNVVTPEYFEIFGIPIVRGRGFTAADRAGSADVVVISEAAARLYFGEQDPLGKTALLGGASLPVTVVGMAADLRHEGLREEPPPMLYTALAQPTESFDGVPGYPAYVTAIMQTRGEPLGIAAAARQLVKEVDARVPVSYVRTMEQQLDAAIVRERLLANLCGAFGFLALVLAFVGLFGVMSYNVAQRTREIGIRMALGARRATVLRRMLQEATAIAALGIVIGLAVATLTSRFVSAFLFGLGTVDPATFGGVALVLFATALIAGYLPARRAALLDPTLAMKGE